MSLFQSDLFEQPRTAHSTITTCTGSCPNSGPTIVISGFPVNIVVDMDGENTLLMSGEGEVRAQSLIMRSAEKEK